MKTAAISQSTAANASFQATASLDGWYVKDFPLIGGKGGTAFTVGLEDGPIMRIEVWARPNQLNGIRTTTTIGSQHTFGTVRPYSSNHLHEIIY